MALEHEFCGCVYDAPSSNKFAPQEVGDLTANQLREMPLVGLPIRASHGKNGTGQDIGRITDEYYDANGGKHISFVIHEGPQFDVYREGIRQNWYSHLSLGHEVYPGGVVAREVSICHLGARDNTTIARTTPHDYKLQLRTRGIAPPPTMSAPTESTATQPMDTMQDATPASSEPAPAVDQPVTEPAVTETPEERALRAMAELDQDKQEAIASAWTMTSQRLADVQEKLEAAEKAQAEYRTENTMLRKASEETAKQLVASLKNAYDEHGTEMPERYHQEIRQQVNANPTLAQALSHAIPVCASAMSRKRQRTEGPTSFNELQGFLRAHVRERGHASFKGDFEAASKVPVQASASSLKTQTEVKMPVTVAEGPGTRMLASLRESLRR